MNNYIPPHPLRTSVLLLIFRRLDTTKRVFEAIRQAQPPRLYIAGDGPRPDKKGEPEKVKAVREYIMKSIDWDCEVNTLFREENLGCKKAVSSAINWYFEQEKMGIILEDDTLPDISFFWFCEQLLEKYQEDTRIMQISGNNYQLGNQRGDGSYYFSQGGGIWGWATWARAWNLFDPDVKKFNYFREQNYISYILADKIQEKVRMKNFTAVFNNKIDSWAYIWAYTIYANNGLCIIPNKNLVINIGFSMDGTHTFKAPSYYSKIQLESIHEITHPSIIVPDMEADKYDFYLHHYQYKSIIRKLLFYLGLEEVLVKLKSVVKSILIKKKNWQ